MKRSIRVRTSIAIALGAVALPAAAQAHPGQLPPLPGGDPVGAQGVFDDYNLIPGGPVPATGGPDRLGSFGQPFTEPTVDGVPTSEKCIADENGDKRCKPAAGTLNVLPDGRIFYWNALEGTENNRFSIVAEGGTTFTNDATRELDLAGPRVEPARAAARRREPERHAGRPADPGRPVEGDLQRRRAVRLPPDLPARRADPRPGRHGLLGRPGRRGHALRRRGARRAEVHPHLRPADQHLHAGRRRDPRPVVPDAGAAGRRKGAQLLRRPEAAQARLPRRPAELRYQRAPGRALRRRQDVGGRGRTGRALAAAVPAHAPTPRREGLLQHVRAVLQPAGAVLRPGDLEPAGALRPGEALVVGARGHPARADPDRLPRLDLLHDAAAATRPPTGATGRRAS